MRTFDYFKKRKKEIDPEIAQLRFHLWSLDIEMDSMIYERFIAFENEGYDNNMKFTTNYNRLQEEVEKIVYINLPEEIKVKYFNVEFTKSVTITFSLFWLGAVSIYELVSRYDSFRRSIERIKEDISRLFEKIIRRNNLRGPLSQEIEFKPSRTLKEVEILHSQQDYYGTAENINMLFVWYLIISNIILASVLAFLLFHAVQTVYFP